MTYVNITIKSIKSLGAGRFQIKVSENHLNLSEISHAGRSFDVVKRLGRGRYIIKEVTKK